MQKPNPVIKNYILNPEPYILAYKTIQKENKNVLKTYNNKVPRIWFTER